MSELQLTLLAVGMGLVVLVWLFNRIQEWRWHRMAKKTLGESRPDPLLTPESTAPLNLDALDRLEEPTISTSLADAVPEDVALSPVSEQGRLDDLDVEAELEALKAEQAMETVDTEPQAKPDIKAIEEREAPSVRSLLMLPKEELVAPPDESIEYLVPLGCTAPVTAKELMQNLARATGTVRGMRWLGRRVTDGGWMVITTESDQRFDSLRAALLLANRSGPITELDLERFCSMVSALATTMTLRVEFPPRSAALVRAQALDEFCAEVDVVLGMNVVAATGQSISGGRIARWAESHGMVLAQDGAYHLLNAQGQSVWRLANRDPRPFNLQSLPEMVMSGVTFLLDVPTVEAANEKLSPMFDAANMLAREVGARVLDDNGQVLGPGQLGRIEKELASLVARMGAEDIPAGSSRARRLFSN